jgi:hypothetical protein
MCIRTLCSAKLRFWLFLGFSHFSSSYAPIMAVLGLKGFLSLGIEDFSTSVILLIRLLDFRGKEVAEKTCFWNNANSVVSKFVNFCVQDSASQKHTNTAGCGME